MSPRKRELMIPVANCKKNHSKKTLTAWFFHLGGKNLRGEGIITDNSTRRRGDRKGVGLGRLAPRLLREVRPDQAPLFPSPTRPEGDRGEALL